VCGEVAEDAVTEDCPMAPTNPYSASKAAAELMVQGYAKSFQVQILVHIEILLFTYMYIPIHTQTQTLAPTNPRSASKAAAELILQGYAKI